MTIKNRSRITSIVLFVITGILIFSCEVGLGAAVDIADPTSSVTYPPKNAVVRDTFIAAGECSDDMSIASVKVTLTNTDTKQNYGPYLATLNEEKTFWSVSINQKDETKVSSLFNSYAQWEIPDGNYVINAVAYDTDGKHSPTASSPIYIDNTAPVLVVSKPLAVGANANDAATVYGRSFKLSGDISEDHEASKLILYYRQYDKVTNAFIGDVKSLEVTDSEALNAMSSSNPLIIAQFEGDNGESEEHQKYVTLYCNQPGDTCTTETNEDKYFYCGFLLEDNARLYLNPGDEGSGTGNQTQNYYILSDDYKDNLAVNYSLTAPKLKDIFKGQSEAYSSEQISAIETILSKKGNFVSSKGLLDSEDDEAAKAVSSKFSINPHNYPTWALDEYAVSASTIGNTGAIKAYTAGSSLILSINAGRDASYPNPQSVNAFLYDMGDYNLTAEFFREPTEQEKSAGKTLIGAGGIIAESWSESADDTVKTYTFSLDTQANELRANHIYQVMVTGVDRNGVAMEPANGSDGRYLFNLSTSNNIPKVTINSPDSDTTFGPEDTPAAGNVNVNGVTVSGWVDTDGVSLHSDADQRIRVKSLVVQNVANSRTVATASDFDFDIPEPVADTTVANRYHYSIHITADASNTIDGKFVPDTESKYLYTVVVQAKDAADSEGERSIKFYVDNKKPDVSVSSVSPKVTEDNNGIIEVNGKIEVKGVASDSGSIGSGLKALSYRILDESGASEVKPSTTISLNESWTFNIETKALADNTNYKLEITAVDALDNTNIITKPVKVNQSTDTPSVSFSNAKDDIVNPDGLGVSANMFGKVNNNKLYGTITDDDGLGRVTLSYLKAGAAAGTAKTPLSLADASKALTSGSKSYAMEYLLPAAEGEYQIFVEAKDIYAVQAESNSSLRQSEKDTYTSSFYVTVDEGAPVFSGVTTSPVTNETTYIMGSKTGAAKTLSVTGTISEGNGLHTTNGSIDGLVSSPASSNITTSAAAASGTFTDSISLPSESGINTVTYTAKDKYGQTSTYTLKYAVDVNDPSISSIKIGSYTINNPDTAETLTGWITSNSVKVEVIASDAHSGISDIKYSVSGGAYTAMTHASSEDSSAGEKWTANISFEEGAAKTIKFQVTDKVDNKKDSATVTLDVDKTKPTLQVKWYKVAESADNSATAGTLITMPEAGTPTAYVNKNSTKDLVIFGNYTDGDNCSGVRELLFKLGSSNITPKELHYFKQPFSDEASIATVMVKNAGNVMTNELSYSEANSKLIKSFVAVFDHDNFADGDLVIWGKEGTSYVAVSDIAGNKIEGETKTVMTLVLDSTKPVVSGISLDMVKTVNNTSTTKAAYKDVTSTATTPVYYIRNTLDGKLTISGTSTDNYNVDKTELLIVGQDDKSYPASTTAKGRWEFKDISLSGWTKNSNTSNPDATISLVAYDEAGNVSTTASVSLVFDENPPEVLNGGENGSDPEDSSNPYKETGYNLRGADVYKYYGIRIGTTQNQDGSIGGSYSESSYGRETSVPLTMTFVDKERRSGIEKIEYKMLSASDANTLGYSGNNKIPTGYFDEEHYEWPVSWTSDAVYFDEVTEDTYKHFNSSVELPCFIGKKTIGGFTSTVAGTPNYVFVRAIDNCGNAGKWFVLHIQIDDSIPQPARDPGTQETLLTNGKSALTELSGTITDAGAGLKAFTIKVDGKTAFTCGGKGSGETEKTIENGYGSITYKGYNSEADKTACSFGDAPYYVEWKLNLDPTKTSGEGAGWFNTISRNSPQVTIEAEDWAEDSSGSGNKNSLLITSLDIDTQNPKASITAPVNTSTQALNGKQTIEGSVTEDHTPQTVELYYSTETNAPDVLGDGSSGWILLQRLTSEAEPEDSSQVQQKTTYGVSAQSLYNFSYATNFNNLIAENAVTGTVHILVIAKDEAGNKNLEKNAVTANQETENNSSKAYRTYLVNRNSDRPVVTVTNTELVEDIGTNLNQPLSEDNYKMLDRNTINITVSDDDGIKTNAAGNKEIEYRITKKGETQDLVGEWKTIELSQNAASISIVDAAGNAEDGKHTLEFRITDSENTVFTSSGIVDATNTVKPLQKIYLKDMASPQHTYGDEGGEAPQGFEDPTIFVNIDTQSPILNVLGIQLMNDSGNVTTKDEAGNEAWITDGYSGHILGGPQARKLRIKVSASDTGSGLDSVSLSAKLNDQNVTVDPIEHTNIDAQSGTYELDIPCTIDGVESDDATLVATITVRDKAGKLSTETLTFTKVDNKKPVISVTSPASTENLSGSVTANGEITNRESVTFWYAISPIEASPDTYAGLAAGSYNFVKYDSSDVATTVTLPAKDKSNVEILPAQALKDLCAYQQMSSRASVTFSLRFDGQTDGTASGLHTETLNQWLKDIGITTDKDLRTSSDPFADVVRLYFHIKAVDSAGNVNELHYPIRVDPLGTRPVVNVGYPSEEKAGPATNGLTIGGKPTIIGTASGTNIVNYVWLQVDTNADGVWTYEDFNTLLAQKVGADPAYTMGNMQQPGTTVTTELASGTDASDYAIKVNVTGINWTQKINLGGELNPAEGSTQKNVTVWAYSTDLKGFTSSKVTRKLIIDSDTPIIEQDIRLVQWKTGYNGSNGFTVDSNGVIHLENASGESTVTAARSYTKDENIKGKWFLIGKVKDDSGLKTIKFNVNKGSTVTAVSTAGTDYTGSGANAGVYIKHVTEKNSENKDVHNYLFCFPIGDETPDAVNEYTIDFSAEENKTGNDTSKATETFSVKYDNKAPVITEKLTDIDTTAITADSPLDIENSNGVYPFGGKATEDKVNGVAQTGLDRIAFYFTRNITGQTTTVFDPMLRPRRNADGTLVANGNAINYSELNGGVLEDGLYWKSVNVSAVNNASITVESVPSFVHKGGLAKVNGVIYRIEGATGTVISLSGAPGDATSVKFAVANVVDNPTVESEGSARITADYGWGYYSDGSYDDGDYMVEALNADNNSWEVSINSRNISDGPVTLNYVVFDKAGNASAVQTVECFVKNNQPRLAGVKLGTDEDGNGEVDDTNDYTEFTTYHIYDKGFNGSNKITALTVPVTATAAEPEAVFTIKGKTVLLPEIVGGNGEVKYTYTVTKRNSANTDWEGEDDYYASYTTARTLGNGTYDDDDSSIALKDSEGKLTGIQISVKEFLQTSIVDGDYQKFSFTISDSTPGLNGTASQSATLDVIMNVGLNDVTPAKNKIIPFYWKSGSNNSLGGNSTANGHIELSKDLPSASFGTGKTYTLYPKVSGAIKLEGIAQDNVLLSELSVTINNDTAHTYDIAKYYSVDANGEKVYGQWHEESGIGWSAEISQATYEDFKNAGYISAYPAGKKGTDTVPYTSQNYGHVVHWTMNIDTQAMGFTPKTGVVITVSAKDKGTPGLTGTGENQKVTYNPRTFNNNGDGTTPAQTGGELGNNTNADGTAAKYTSRYLIDIVPYITRIETALSKKSNKTDTSEFDRTALGHYPVADDETEIKISGFNLTGTTSEVYFTSSNANAAKKTYVAGGIAIPDNAKSGEVYIEVDGVRSLNNLNENDAHGSYETQLPALDKYGDTETKETYAHFYNREPNEQNNYTLTDNVVFDIWQFNSDAAEPNGGGRIDEVAMKINPNSTDGLIGFAFLNSFSQFAAPGNGTSYSNKGKIGGEQDFRSTATLAYDYRGWSYATDAGGNEGDRIKFWIMNASGTEQTSVSFELINQSGPRDMSNSTNVDLRYKVRSPSIATSKAEATTNTNSTNIYFAYYDSYNDEIRFKAGNSDTSKRGTLSGRQINEYTCQNSQVIATDAEDNLPNGISYSTEYPVLGGAGEFVSIDVVPKYTYKGTNNVITNNNITNDVVVIVWYDAVAKALKYAYNTNPLDTSWQVTDNHYCGLNSKNWAGKKTIFTGAGEYCQVKVDSNGGIHIAAYDSVYGDLKYAYLPSYSSTYDEDTMSYTVDSYGNTGSHLVLDVGLDSNDNPVPYITYWGSSMPKLAYMTTAVADRYNGTLSDMFTGKWEAGYIPTSSKISDLDQKYLNNLDNRINVALWKDRSGNITDSVYKASNANQNDGKCYGNGTSNPVVGYSILAEGSTTDDRIETAQMK